MAEEPTGAATPRTAIPVPHHTDDPPGWLDHYMRRMAEKIETMVVGKYADATTRDAAVSAASGLAGAYTGPDEGDLAYLLDTGTLTIYDGSAWQQVWPILVSNISGFTASTSDPTGGVDGDIHFKYV